MDTNEEKKQDKKKDGYKTAIISSVCALLLLIIILLLVIFGCKYCSNIHGDHGSYSSADSSSGGPTYNYDNESLNNQFIKIVNYERLVAGYEEAPTRVVAVTYTDNYPNSFSLSITALGGTTVYYYHLDNYSYTGETSSYDNCIGYILTLNISDRLDNTASLSKGDTLDSAISPNKGGKYVIYSTNPNKYFSGFYYENNEYRIYQHIEFNSGDNPFNEEPTLKVDSTEPLYGYYQLLNQ